MTWLLAVAALAASYRAQVGTLAYVATERAELLGRAHLTWEQAAGIAAGALDAQALPGGPPAPLTIAILETETEYAPRRSPAGCQGLMQMAPDTQRATAGKEPLDGSYRQQVRLGGTYLRVLGTKVGRWSRAAAAYNMGPAAWRRAGQPITDYVRRVKARWKRLKEEIR